MSLDPAKVKIAEMVVSQFLNFRRAAPRKPMLIEVRDSAVLDDMESRTLLRAENDRASYFPTLGTFPILADDDDRLMKARRGTLQVLHTLTNLYEVYDSEHSYSDEELIDHVRTRYEAFDAEEIRLGLYLSVSEFGAVQSYRRSEEGTEILSFRLAESVLKLSSPEEAWMHRIVISRNNASLPSQSIQPPHGVNPPNEVVAIRDFANPWNLHDELQQVASSTHDTTSSANTANPKVFISYAWESDDLKEWVGAFATRLREQGVDVTLDQWHLQLGHDRLQFMERSVSSAEFVLIICTPTYAEKANDRTGGVGYESNILTCRIFERADKQTFIPLLRSGTWATSLPTWSKHLTSCDLTGEPYAEAQFEKLLKQLHGKGPKIPAIGPVPTFD